jgi:hypothetical protein
MRRVLLILGLLIVAQTFLPVEPYLGAGSPPTARNGCATFAQRVVDRIVARIEGDIITQSEVRELGRFQQLLEGKAAGEEELLRQLIDQWVVATEAAASRFEPPTDAEVKGEFERLQKEFVSPGTFRTRLRELQLEEAAVRRLLGRQIWLSRYLDYKFRPAAQVDDAEIERYYREELSAQLRSRGQAPPLEDVREQIRELLTQREISRRADRWLSETRPRLRIDMNLGGAKP